jgi:hypothetical protein
VGLLKGTITRDGGVPKDLGYLPGGGVRSRELALPEIRLQSSIKHRIAELLEEIEQALALAEYLEQPPGAGLDASAPIVGGVNKPK